MLQARMNIQLKVEHVMGDKNPTADALSRLHMSKYNLCIEQLLELKYEQYHVHMDQFHLDFNTL